MSPGRTDDVIKRRRIAALITITVVVALCAVVVSNILKDRSSLDPNPYVINYGPGATPRAAPTETPSESKTEPTTQRVTASDMGNLVISGISGMTPSTGLLDRVKRGELAGVIIMGENVDTVDQVAAIGSALRRAAKQGHQPPPLIMTDQEGGDVVRFKTAGPGRSASELGRLSDTDVTDAGRKTGNDLLQRRVNVNLAPVADVHDNSSNFLGTRTFGSSNAGVKSSACAFSLGLRNAGVIATLKHFPGLGRAGATNTDVAPVSINGSQSTLRSSWGPYKKCSRNDGTMVMMSNAAYPDAFGIQPAAVNRGVYRALRRDIGFTGVIITDSLSAGGLKSVPNIPVAALNAGADLLLYVGEPDADRATKELVSAFRNGELNRKSVSSSLERVRVLREILDKHQ